MLIDKELTDIYKKIENYDVISFDIFDTLVFRPFNKPLDFFEYIESKYKVKNFKKNRIKSEKKILNTKKEATYEDIYQNIKYDKNIEKKEELRLCSANRYIKEIYDYVLNSNKKIIVVSDIYYDKEFIAELLKKNGYDNFYRLYVSSELQHTKRHNDIWKTVLKDLGIQPSKILHIGDNKKSDFKNPRKYGISTVQSSKLKDILFKTDIRQKKILRKNLLISSQYVGVNQSVDYSNGYWYRFGYCYAGVILYGYAKFILDNAKRDNISDVLFVARDGYFLKKIFDIIALKSNSSIRSTYFYLNRAILKNVKKEKLKDYLNSIIKKKNGYVIVDSISIYRSAEKTLQKLLNLSLKGYYFNLLKKYKDDNVRTFNNLSDIKMFFGAGYVRLSEFIFSSKEVEVLSLNENYEPIYKDVPLNQIKEREKRYEEIFKGAKDWLEFFTDKFGLITIDHKFISKIIRNFSKYCNYEDLLHISEYNHSDNNKIQTGQPLWKLKKWIYNIIKYQI